MQETCLAIFFYIRWIPVEAVKDSLVPRLCERLGKISYDANRQSMRGGSAQHFGILWSYIIYALMTCLSSKSLSFLSARESEGCYYGGWTVFACILKRPVWLGVVILDPQLFVAWHISQQPRLMNRDRGLLSPVYGSLIRTHPPPDILLSM